MASPEKFIEWVTNQAMVLANATNSIFGASGASHAIGLVPDPGSSAGTVKYLREDATWAGTFGASGGSHSAGLVPDPGSSAGTTRFLREDATWVASQPTIDLVFVIGDGTNVITTGITGNWSSQFDFAATIVQQTIVAKQSGSISIDVLKCTYTQFDAGATHPVIGDKISASAPITFSSATKAQDSTLSGWATAINAGDILAFNVSSVTTCTQVTINIKVTKTS